MLLTIIIICIKFIATDSHSGSQQPMYVCLCKGITDSQIRAAMAGGAHSLRDVRDSLGVASQCGKCVALTREILREAPLGRARDGGQLCYAAG